MPKVGVVSRRSTMRRARSSTSSSMASCAGQGFCIVPIYASDDRGHRAVSYRAAGARACTLRRRRRRGPPDRSRAVGRSRRGGLPRRPVDASRDINGISLDLLRERDARLCLRHSHRPDRGQGRLERPEKARGSVCAGLAFDTPLEKLKNCWFAGYSLMTTPGLESGTPQFQSCALTTQLSRRDWKIIGVPCHRRARGGRPRRRSLVDPGVLRARGAGRVDWRGRAS